LDKTHFGVFLPFYLFRGETNPYILFNYIRDIVLECESLGYHSVWIDDHLMYGKAPILESWSTLAALASATKRIRLGTMVTSSGFRNAAVLAKIAATVDCISNGRLEFGLGAGIQRNEHEAYGLTFPGPSARINRMKEVVEIVKAMWTQEKTTYKGKYFQVNTATCEPKPLQKPHPPITIGGSGEKLTLGITAKHADRFDFGYLSTLEQYTHRLQVLESHCKAVGRLFKEIEKSCWPSGQILLGNDKQALQKRIDNIKPKGISQKDFEKFTFAGSTNEFVEIMKPFRTLGVTYFMLFFSDLPDLFSLRAFAQEILQKPL